MARPPTVLTLQYHTTGTVALELGLDRYRVKQWIERGILPKPTHRDEQGTRVFDDNWLVAAKAILDRLNGKISFEKLLTILNETGVDHEIKPMEEPIE